MGHRKFEHLLDRLDHAIALIVEFEPTAIQPPDPTDPFRELRMDFLDFLVDTTCFWVDEFSLVTGFYSDKHDAIPEIICW
jgi:hypothetical protein